eukprot:4039143-Pleurochrysis_carterae.AAC.1
MHRAASDTLPHRLAHPVPRRTQHDCLTPTTCTNLRTPGDSYTSILPDLSYHPSTEDVATP